MPGEGLDSVVPGEGAPDRVPPREVQLGASALREDWVGRQPLGGEQQGHEQVNTNTNTNTKKYKWLWRISWKRAAEGEQAFTEISVRSQLVLP